MFLIRQQLSVLYRERRSCTPLRLQTARTASMAYKNPDDGIKNLEGSAKIPLFKFEVWPVRQTKSRTPFSIQYRSLETGRACRSLKQAGPYEITFYLFWCFIIHRL
jgi:hypothetical protein